MKNISKIKLSILLIISSIFIANICYAAWWGTPGYEWALSKNLTSVKTVSQLNSTVDHTDLYATMIKYLKMKGIESSSKEIPHTENVEAHSNVVSELFIMINDYIKEEGLTTNEYRQVEALVEHTKTTLKNNSSFLTRENLKNLNLYMDLSKYRAATLITNRAHREYYLAKVSNVKNTEIFDYGILPYAGDITRREFLIVMYNLLSDSGASAEQIITSLNESGVLLGYNNDLMLDRELTYSELLAFLYRFEGYDFNSIQGEDQTEDQAENQEETQEQEEEV